MTSKNPQLFEFGEASRVHAIHGDMKVVYVGKRYRVVRGEDRALQVGRSFLGIALEEEKALNRLQLSLIVSTRGVRPRSWWTPSGVIQLLQ